MLVGREYGKTYEAPAGRGQKALDLSFEGFFALFDADSHMQLVCHHNTTTHTHTQTQGIEAIFA